MSCEYGARAEVLSSELQENLDKIKRQKKLGVGRLAEAIFYLIRTRHQTVRESYIGKNLNKLVRILRFFSIKHAKMRFPVQNHDYNVALQLNY
jgi:hypothetical protein